MSTGPTIPEPPRALTLAVNRTELRAWDWGPEDAAPIVCAHGAYDHGRMFDEVAAALAADGHRVVALDLRGHGDSGPLSTGHTFEASVLDIAAVVKSLGEPAGLLGHSMGAGMLFGVAATWPELARWVISFDGLGPPASGFGDFSLEAMAEQAFSDIAKRAGRGRRVFPDFATLAAQRGDINTRMPPRWVEHLARHGSRPEGNGFVWKWDPLFNTFLPDGFSWEWVTADFAAVECPVLVVRGGAEDMWTFPEDEVPDRVSHLRDLELHTVHDAGHYLHLEQAAETLGHVRSFIERVDR